MLLKFLFFIGMMLSHTENVYAFIMYFDRDCVNVTSEPGEEQWNCAECKAKFK